jgi:hypothetical protein
MAATFWASQRPIVAVLRAKHEGPIVRVCKIGVLRGFNVKPMSTYTGRHLIGSRPICGLQRAISNIRRHVDRRHARDMPATCNKNPIKPAKINAVPREKNTLLMTLYPSIEKSIIQLFRYCTYPVLYEKPVQNDKNGYFSRVYRGRSPPANFFRPLF